MQLHGILGTASEMLRASLADKTFSALQNTSLSLLNPSNGFKLDLPMIYKGDNLDNLAVKRLINPKYDRIRRNKSAEPFDDYHYNLIAESFRSLNMKIPMKDKSIQYSEYKYKIVWPDEEYESFDSSVIYIFVLSKDTVHKRWEVLTNKSIFSCCAEERDLNLLLNEAGSHRINKFLIATSIRIPSYIERIGYLIYLISTLVVSYILSLKIVDKFSSVEPDFNNFVISSNKLLKFGELEHTNTDKCSICFDEFTVEEMTRLLECGHYFHPACIDYWLVRHSDVCPCCRKHIEVVEAK
ncbi:hypothetical protein ENBRE01_1385 [Enteropsectra breve]|nr:hypothetical protein ENBRE01_1385 [Enteropsectra breve]